MAQVQSLAQELPHATGTAKKKKGEKNCSICCEVFKEKFKYAEILVNTIKSCKNPLHT